MSTHPSHDSAGGWAQFRRGLRHGAPVILAVIPFSLLFGVVATEAGFSLGQTLAMATIVMAGASTLAAIEVLADGAPMFVAVVAGVAVNLRMLIYSASLSPHLSNAPLSWRMLAAYVMVDHVYAMSLADCEEHPDRTMAEKFGYYFGTAISVVPFWVAFAAMGAVLGAAIPPEIGLNFAAAIMFTALFAPMIKARPHAFAAITATVVALALHGLPFSLGLIVGGISGMAAGAFADWYAEARP